MSDRDASLDEASNIAFKALKEKPPAKPVDIYFQGGNMEVYSFTSSKNTKVSSVQFVIKTSEIKKEEVKEDKKTKEEQTFFQKFISLFTDLFN